MTTDLLGIVTVQSPRFLDIPKAVAFWSTVVCVAFTAFHAWESKRSLSPPASIALSLFTLSWAFLLPYYGSFTRSDILPAFSSILYVFISEFLLSLRNEQHPHRIGRYNVSTLSSLALIFLVFLIIPSMIDRTDTNYAITLKGFKVFSHVIGFVSIYIAMKYFCATSERWSRIIPLVLFSYLGTDLLFAVLVAFKLPFGNNFSALASLPADLFLSCSNSNPQDFWSCPSQEMNAFFSYAFAVLKIAYTLLFVRFITKKFLREKKTPNL